MTIRADNDSELSDSFGNATLALTENPKTTINCYTMMTTASNAHRHLNAYRRPLDPEFQRFDISKGSESSVTPE